MIVIIDYGMGNLGSIANMIRQIGVPAEVTDEPGRIESADRLILAGVGAFDAGMQHLHDTNLIPLLEQKVLKQKTPFLGICLGMQLLAFQSEEGNQKGLGWVNAETLRFQPEKIGPKHRVPHMGWNEILVQKPHPLLAELGEEPRFYFVHSYYVNCLEKEAVLATTDYGLAFDSVLGKGNILGTQFHPEKSHRYGRKILENFINWNP